MSREYPISVVEVDGGSGVGSVERGWTLFYMARSGQSRDCILQGAALEWFKETDQSEDCRVSLRAVCAANGTEFIRAVRVCIAPVATTRKGRKGREAMA